MFVGHGDVHDPPVDDGVHPQGQQAVPQVYSDKQYGGLGVLVAGFGVLVAGIGVLVAGFATQHHVPEGQPVVDLF